MHDEFNERGLTIIGVYCVADAKQDTFASTNEFAKSKKFLFPVLFDSENVVSRRYGVKGFPASFLIDQKGKIVWKGDPRGKEIEEALKMHLPARKIGTR